MLIYNPYIFNVFSLSSFQRCITLVLTELQSCAAEWIHIANDTVEEIPAKDENTNEINLNNGHFSEHPRLLKIVY